MTPDELTDKAIDYMFKHGFSRLTPWETSFIESVEDAWRRMRTLTDRQKEVLGRIWDKQS